MIFNHYRCILKIRNLIKFRCDKMCTSPGIHISEAVGKKSSECGKVKTKKGPKRVLKRDERTAVQTNSSDASGKDKCPGKEAMPAEGSVVQAGNADMKDGSDKKEEMNPIKEDDVVINDFLIRNIMTFPLHVTVDESEISITDESTVKKFPSVTSILHETMAADARKRLELWKQKMIELMGPEKFISYQSDPVKKVKGKRLKCNKRSKKLVVATLNRGTRFHSALKSYLSGEDMGKVTVTKEVEGCWNSVKSILADISEVKVVETDVFHPHLRYKGIIDCVASYKNTPHVIEWKQSEKVKKDLSSTFDAPIQLAAYMGALPWCKKAGVSAPITRGMVVVAYYDGAPAEVFQMDLDFCQSYWEQWLRRVQRYWATRSHTLKKPGC